MEKNLTGKIVCCPSQRGSVADPNRSSSILLPSLLNMIISYLITQVVIVRPKFEFNYLVKCACN